MQQCPQLSESLALNSVANSNELSFLRFSLTEKWQWVKELCNWDMWVYKIGAARGEDSEMS